MTASIDITHKRKNILSYFSLYEYDGKVKENMGNSQILEGKL
jgi:hypothetical protein